MSTPINMHAARTALNNDPELRKWVEAWLKKKERAVEVTMTDEEFEKHWLYVRPERMHEGALEAQAVRHQITHGKQAEGDGGEAGRQDPYAAAR